jgi:hypothetical protein
MSAVPVTRPKIIATGSAVVTRLNRAVIEPVLMPGQKVRVQQGQQFAIYEVPRYDAPEVLPEVYINFASFSQQLPLLADSGAQSVLNKSLTDLDVVAPSLAQYRLVPLTPGVQFEVSQPAVVGKFVNKNGVIRIDWSAAQTHIMTGNWGMLPEVWVFGDQTPIQAKAINMSMNETKPVATLCAYGFRYPLDYIETKIGPDGRIFYTDPAGQLQEIQTVMTVNVGQTQGR